MSILFSPLQIRSVELKNRIVVSPMCQYSAENGFANDWHLVHYGSRAVGGASLIFIEATAVSPNGRITAHDLGIWQDDQIIPLKKITQFIEQQGAFAGIQLAHAGRKASCEVPWKGGNQLNIQTGGWTTIAPSNLPFKKEHAHPNALTIKDINIVIDDFKQAAERCLKAGFKVVEIHAAHGYLIHQFLSPLSNQRTDLYGGSFENRTRLLIEIIQAIQLVWPATLPIFVRISATEWVDDGWNIDDSVKLATMLKNWGIDVIDCSSGGNIMHAKIPLAPGYQVQLADKIKKESTIKTASVGLITSAVQAEEILKNEAADLIFIGREMLRNPYFGLIAAKELKDEVIWPLQYQRAK